MKVLVVGSGGREHAVITALSRSEEIDHIYCAPGNGGIAALAECVAIKATDVEAMTVFAKEHADFCVVTPDDPLALGMVDAMEAEGIPCFGPHKNAAIIEASKAFSKELMHKYRIEYDTWFLESELHKKEVGEVIDILTEKGYTYEKDGALWFAAAKVGGEEYKDEVLVRSNGTPTYFTADIAYHRNKLSKRGFSRAIDIWGADHHGHVARLKNALNAVGENGDKLDVVLMQLVRLIKDGKPAKMSKRTGKAITLEDLLNDIPADAVRFLFNMRESTSQMDFDLDLAVEQSSQNPVYYVQYAHARICSIIRKMEEEGVTVRTCSAEELKLLNSEEELAIIRHLASLTEEIITAAKAYDPARITRFVTTLATLFHKFYNARRVAVEDEALMMARLNLCLAVKTTIKSILEMFKITAPEKM